MLQYFRLKNEIQSTNSIVSFSTFNNCRVDISKKFLKKDPVSERWYFTKNILNLETSELVSIKTFIILGEVYIAECKDPALECDALGNTILIVRDLVSFQELKTYRGTNNAEETYRS